MLTLERMDATFERLKRDEDATLSRDFVRAAMDSTDLEIAGTAYQFLADERNVARITPPLDFAEIAAFATAYLGRCLREDPLAVDFIAQRSCTRYGAGWEVVRWYVRLFKAEPADGAALRGLRAMLAQLYREGDGSVRAAIAGVTLSHLFASAAVRLSFAEWKSDPVLAEAFAAARPVRATNTGVRVKRAQPLTKKSSTAIRT
jgi:hypothetical protein